MDAVVRELLKDAGRTYAEDAGITLKDQPAPLFKLVVMANLMSARISAAIAVAAGRELFAVGGGTPRGMAALTWQDRVNVLRRSHYARYDESTATRLGRMAEMVQEDYGGDLRRLARDADHDVERARELIQRFPGIGPTGSDIFCREAQGVWTWLRPYFDRQTLKGADRLGLPLDAKRLGDLVPDRDLARFAAALVRVAHDGRLADRLVPAD